MRYELVIFDLDGTILDTLEDLAESVNFALGKNGLPLRKKEEVRQFLGNGIRRLIALSVPEGTPLELSDRVFADFFAHYKVHLADKTAPYPGISELIGDLRSAGIKTAVISNKADEAVLSLCEKYFGGLFDCVMGERQGIRRKPAPDSVYSAAKSLGVPKEKILYIGDSEVDIETAANAGIDLIAVSWGFRDKALLQKCGAKVIADSPKEIYDRIFG